MRSPSAVPTPREANAAWASLLELQRQDGSGCPSEAVGAAALLAAFRLHGLPIFTPTPNLDEASELLKLAAEPGASCVDRAAFSDAVATIPALQKLCSKLAARPVNSGRAR